MVYRYPITGYAQTCNCCSGLFANAPGARAYLRHLAQATYYGVRMSPEATWTLGAKARDYLVRVAPDKSDVPNSFAEWVQNYYPGWKPCGPDIIPVAYGWVRVT